MWQDDKLCHMTSLGNDASAGWVPTTDAVSVFPDFGAELRTGDPKNVTIQTFIWMILFLILRPSENFFPEQLCIQQACVCWIFGSLLFPTKLMRRWFTHGRDDIQIAQYTEKALRDLSPLKFESQNSKLSRHGLTSWLYSLGGPIL